MTEHRRPADHPDRVLRRVFAPQLAKGVKGKAGERCLLPAGSHEWPAEPGCLAPFTLLFLAELRRIR